MQAHIEIVADTRCALGESPVWNPVDHQLYWIDINAGLLFSYDPVQSRYRELYRGEVIGGCVVHDDGSILLLGARGRVRRFHEGRIGPGIRIVPGQEGFRFNDAIVDPSGRVLSGTLAVPARERGGIHRFAWKVRRRFGIPDRAQPRRGNVYRIGGRGDVDILVKGVGRPNGMGFSPDHRGFYLTDTLQNEILEFNYDESSGKVANPRGFARIEPSQGRHDGLCVDRDGGVWSAIMDGGCIIRYTPEGREEQRISLPARKVTSLAFGGDDLADLYVTTAGGGARDRHGPASGALLRMDVGVGGMGDHLARVNW